MLLLYPITCLTGFPTSLILSSHPGLTADPQMLQACTPHGLRTCSFSLGLPSSRSSHASSLTSVRFLLQCHLLPSPSLTILWRHNFPSLPSSLTLNSTSLQGSPLSAITPHITSSAVSALETRASLVLRCVASA